jgi:hypothetical protein
MTMIATNPPHVKFQFDADRIPAPLKVSPNFVAWRYEHTPGEPEPKKVPYNPNSPIANPRRASVTNPRSWGTYLQTLAFARAAGMDGIGLVLTPELGLTLVDLDDCFDDNGNLLPWAVPIVAMFAGSYMEYSPSGRGLHIYVWGTVDSLKTPGIELYSHSRYTTITGNVYGDPKPVAEAQAALDALRDDVAPLAPPKPVLVRPTGPQGHAGDDRAILALLNARPKFAALLNGDIGAYVNPKTGELDDSRADYALINGFLYYVGADVDRTARLFRGSALYRPEKHDKRNAGQLHLEKEIDKALATWTGDFYRWPTPKRTTSIVSPAPDAPPPTHVDYTPTLQEQVMATRHALRSAGLRSNDLAMLDGLCDLALERNSADLIPCSHATGGRVTNLPRATVGRALKRVVEEGRIELDWEGDRITKCARYSLKLTSPKWVNGEKVQTNNDDPTSKTTLTHFGEVSFYSDHRSADIFSTGGGMAALALGNELRPAGKLAALLIDVIRGHGGEMTVLQLASATNRNEKTINKVLKYTVDIGLLERRQECANRAGRRFWYSVPGDIEERIALLTLDVRTYGVAVDRAMDSANAMAKHAETLLDEENTTLALPLEPAQIETLKQWAKLAPIEAQGLAKLSDLAGQIDKSTVRATILEASPENRNRRAITSAKQFVQTVLSDLPELTERQAIRLFGYWLQLFGYYDLRGTGQNAQLRLSAALHDALRARPPVERTQLGHIGDPGFGEMTIIQPGPTITRLTYAPDGRPVCAL